ncbi:alpha/beta-hydrolase [Wallemia mellicola]|uniref:Alpha/beta-hydrolase n=1 Tax=Wallemia mellicola TaxID=1708541 RepID=A0A4T0R4D6_9BASI|nr:alpha/beta-hydrolase [Wallemia mellicola]TIC09313.1 alpha/beta-hydrolase [Wallemia mellicola]TIC28174.1 alpha/beta-hydrolase [Wallemia mellicola]TIC31588.1 alpha/beta-hydrolase [Wallemia mellicola]
MIVEHKSAKVHSGINIAYTTRGNPAQRAILLIHGYPQTRHSMTKLQNLLSDAGYFTVAVDYRGAGGSSITTDGYEKMTMSADLHGLMMDVFGCRKYTVLGQDIGAMIAVAQAMQFRDSVEASHLATECPLPGTSQYDLCVKDRNIASDDIFHFFFHQPRDLPELLTQGKESQYLQHFYDRLSFKPGCMSKDDVDEYVRAFSRVGRMRAGFELYRAFRRDEQDVKANLAEFGKLSIPVLATGGEHSLFTTLIEGMAAEVAYQYDFGRVRDSAHWVSEENANGLFDLVSWFLKKHLDCT